MIEKRGKIKEWWWRRSWLPVCCDAVDIEARKRAGLGRNGTKEKDIRTEKRDLLK
jgi:hypothetical protein